LRFNSARYDHLEQSSGKKCNEPFLVLDQSMMRSAASQTGSLFRADLGSRSNAN
jgi:hypothetical protein